jgi:hypothetical protein
MLKSKRPWHKHACIEKVELNNGDVRYETFVGKQGWRITEKRMRERHGTFETLDAAEGDLGAWWPTQVKSRRPA